MPANKFTGEKQKKIVFSFVLRTCHPPYLLFSSSSSGSQDINFQSSDINEIHAVKSLCNTLNIFLRSHSNEGLDLQYLIFMGVITFEPPLPPMVLKSVSWAKDESG